MARIIMSVCGEGRGHASRAITLIDELEKDHDFLVISFGTGFEYLNEYIQGASRNIRLEKIAGISYLYSGTKLAPVRTYFHWMKFIIFRLGAGIRRVEECINDFKPDLAIVDFEPCLPRAAQRCGIRCISIDHQHFIRFCKTDTFPLLLRIRAKIGAWVCRLYVPFAERYLVTAFFRGELRDGLQSNVLLVGPVIRKAISSIESSDCNFIVSYLRRSIPSSLINAFLACGLPVVVYGLGKRKAIGNIIFKEVSQDAFARDLAHATAVVAAAGNQVIGESIYFGKPFFAIPEKDHHEQVMNSLHLEKLGVGTFSTLETITLDKLMSFLADRNRYTANLLSTASLPVANVQICRTIQEILEEY